MGGREGAGRSADEWSRHLRAEAARLESQAARVEQGARGERLTGAVLDPLSGDGWFVLHDLAVPGSSANIDHVAVTPAGVFVIDSKAWTGTVSDGKGTLWTGRFPKTQELSTLAWETEAVANAVSAALPGWPVAVRPVISLTDAVPRRPVLTAGPVTAVAVADVVGHLSSFPPLLSPHQITSVAHAIAARLPSKTGLPSAMVTPDPVPPLSAFAPPPPPGWWAPPAAAPARPVRPRGGTRRPSNGRRTVGTRRGGSSLVGALGRAAIGLVALFIGLGVIGAMIKHAGSSLTTTPSAGAPAAPARLQVSWSCPTPKQGWTATLAWPGGTLPGGTTAVESAPGASGPWSLQRTFQGSQPVQLSGIHGSSTEWVRAGSLVTLQSSGRPVMQGELTAPAGC